ncbi:MAG: OB-fold domain-containing protein [Deltaproteobacteria bacterium]|jgi:uncharacterized OB-fold protein|nr:OB-fold domain-containing protein [Deltaproteobacteria bacterium]
MSPIPIDPVDSIIDFAPDDLDRPFWEGCQRGEFLLQRCPRSGRWHWPAGADPETGSDLEWTAASGRGTIHTFTIIHKAFRPEFAERVPYNVIVVELEEGPFFHSNLIECENSEIRVGMPVEVVLERLDQGMTLPRFRPRSER